MSENKLLYSEGSDAGKQRLGEEGERCSMSPGASDVVLAYRV